MIGVFDSGIGGLSVYREIHRLLPGENKIYLADQLHVPYGKRPMQEVHAFARAITRYLLGRGADLIVIACNTASAAALYALREEFPDVPFVGMEPAVKPAAEQTNTGVVGVLATTATFQGELFNSVVERFAQDVKVLTDVCPGLVEQIEAGNLAGQETERILRKALEPMLEHNIDRVVMGCTHYPFVIPLIKKIVGKDVLVIDPARAIALQTERLLIRHKLRESGQLTGIQRFLTTGELQRYEQLIMDLMPPHEPFNFEHVEWGEILSH